MWWNGAVRGGWVHDAGRGAVASGVRSGATGGARGEVALGGVEARAHAGERGYQLRYSELQPLMADVASRRQKARKILSVLRDALAPRRSKDLRLLDVGASTGIIAGELGRAFGEVVGIDVDEPGIQSARERLTGPNQTLMVADAMAMPFEDASFDVVVANHVYEHVPDPERLFAEIWRVLRPGGLAYVAAGNRLTLIEPHYRLPFLSWLPVAGSDLYLRALGRGDRYYERMRTYPAIRRLVRRFAVEDYTLRVLSDPERYAAGDVVRRGGLASRLPDVALRAGRMLWPTYLLVIRKPEYGEGDGGPADDGERDAARGGRVL